MGRTRAEAHGGEPFSLGVDENGLGPRLGPLIVSSVLARTTGDGGTYANARRHWCKGALKNRLDDSKRLVSYDDSALGEAWGRAIARRMGIDAQDPDALVHALALDGRDVLRAPCPPHDPREQCWSAEGERFQADEALVAKITGDLEKLEAQGVAIVRARVAIVCAKRLNDEAGLGRSRFDVDLHAMERLVLAARKDAGAALFAACGKVGGFDRYRFGPIVDAGCLHVPLVEGRARSEYSVAGVGRVAFVRDADASHLLVAMASLVGKWIRDTLMRRIVRFHRVLTPDLPDASGYHDPVTAGFVDATQLLRRSRDVPPRCFERERVDAGRGGRG